MAALTTITESGKVRTAPMLVLMIQLTKNGKPFDQIISDTVAYLRQHHPDTYRAFGIISTFHRLGLSVPSSILETLMREYPGFLVRLRSDVIKGMSQQGIEESYVLLSSTNIESVGRPHMNL